MSQRCVEAVIGRLATDEAFRNRFHADRDAAHDELTAQGAEPTPVEQRALVDGDLAPCEDFAERLDPRIQKVCLRRSK